MLKSSVLKAVKIASKAIQDLGVDALLVKRTAKTYVPGQIVQYTETTTAVKVVVSNYLAQEIDGDRVQATDLKGLVMPASNVDIYPEVNDAIRMNGADWRILSNQAVRAGDKIALSEVQLRLR